MFPELPPGAVNLREWAVWATAIGTCLFGAWRYVLKPRIVLPCRLAWQRVSTALTTVERIGSELGPNGGRTLVDKVNRIDVRTRRTDALQCVVIGAMPQAVFETDAGGGWLTVSRKLELLTGYDGRHLMDMGWVNLVATDDRQHVLREITHAIRDKRAWLVDCVFLSRTGASLHVRFTADPMVDDAVDPKVIVGWFGAVEARA